MSTITYDSTSEPQFSWPDIYEKHRLCKLTNEWHSEKWLDMNFECIIPRLEKPKKLMQFSFLATNIFLGIFLLRSKILNQNWNSLFQNFDTMRNAYTKFLLKLMFWKFQGKWMFPIRKKSIEFQVRYYIYIYYGNYW